MTTIHEVINIITESKLLSEEDFNLISSLDVDKEHHHILRLSWHVVPLGGFLGVVSWALKSPVFIITLPALLLYAAVCLAGERHRRLCLRSVTALVGALQELQSTSKKALRRLQENELIARGFMFSVTGSSVERLENSSLPSLTRRWHTLPGLREGLLSALGAAVHSLTKATRVLVECYPLRGQLDRQQFYLAFEEVDFFSTVNVAKEEEGGTSQEVKIDVLKVLQNCYLLLQSEFLRRLILTFHPELRAETSRVNTEILSALLEDISTLTKQLDTEYRIFSTYGIPRRSPSSEPPVSGTPKKLKYDDLFVSVHSTKLHLQNILYRTHAVEEYLETRENLDVDSELSMPDLQTALNDILKELDMCKSCCERGISFLGSLNNPEESKNLEEDEVCPSRNRCENEDIKQIHVGKTDLDPDVEDEVFEAISTADYFDDVSDLYDSIVCSKTEKQQQKNCSKLMLDELKSILVDKAKEWKEREEKALKNKRAREGLCEAGISLQETESADTLALKTEISNSQYRSVEEETELTDPVILKTEITDDKIRPVDGEVKVMRMPDPVVDECQQLNSSVSYEEKSSFGDEGSDEDFNLRKIVSSENGKTGTKMEDLENDNVHDTSVFKSKFSSPFGFQSTPLPHRFMVKDSETFCGTGEHSSSEDSDNE